MKYSEFLETRWIAFGISFYDEAAFNAIPLDSLNFKKKYHRAKISFACK